MSEKLRLGIIGTGGIVRIVHVPAIRQLEQIELAAICDIDRPRVQRLAEQWGVGEVFYDYKDLIKSKNVEAVLITSPNALHREHTIAAAGQKKHVLCEKPMAITVKDAVEMVEACRQNRVTLQLGFFERFFNQIKIAKKLIDGGVIGEVKSFESIYRVHEEDRDEIDSDFRDDLSLAGGGCLMDITVHQVDLARHLVGEINQVCAEVKHSVGGFGAKFEDNTLILCDFADGAIGSLSTNRFSPFMHRTFLYGTEGTLFIATHTHFQAAPLALYTLEKEQEIPAEILSYFYPELAGQTPTGRWINVIPPNDVPYSGQLESFCRSIRSGTAPEVTGNDGVKALQVVLAAYESAQERRWVEIADPAGL